MRSLFVSAVGIALSAFSASGAMAGSDSRYKFEISQDVASKYVWRGINLVNDWVYQPSLSVEAYGFKLSVWGSCELTGWNAPNFDQNPARRFTEIDSTLQYSGTLGDAGWTVGVIDYQFAGTGAVRYQEWFGDVAFDGVWGSPTVTVYKGNNGYSGTYATLGLSRPVPARLGRAREIEVGAELSYGDAECNRFLYNDDGAGLTDLHLHASAELGLGRGWTLSPSLHYSNLLRQGLLQGEARRSNVWVVVYFGLKF